MFKGWEEVVIYIVDNSLSFYFNDGLGFLFEKGKFKRVWDEKGGGRESWS